MNKLKYYFSLQTKIQLRHLKELGISPWVGFVVVVALFLGVSFYLYYKTEFAKYLYHFVALSIIAGLGEAKRNDFLKTCYSKSMYYLIRLLENSLAAIPFFSFQLYKTNYPEALIFFFLSLLIALINFRNKYSMTIPTPFSKYPFEFTIGFRHSFLLIVLAYFITYKAIEVGNFNLGIFSLIVVLFICAFYYIKQENWFYVWIFSLNPKDFLFQKLKTAVLYSSLLSLPISIALGIFYQDKLLLITGFQILGILIVITGVLSKYSAYPHELSIRKVLAILLSIWLPVLLIITIPVFYFQSKKQLGEILHD